MPSAKKNFSNPSVYYLCLASFASFGLTRTERAKLTDMKWSDKAFLGMPFKTSLPV